MSLIVDLVHEGIKLAGGNNSDAKLVDRIAEKAREAVAAVIMAELRQLYAVLGLTIAFRDLGDVATALLQRMREAESGGGLPKILDGARIEQVSEITDEDRSREAAGFEELRKP